MGNVVLDDAGDDNGEGEAERDEETYLLKCGKREDVWKAEGGRIGDGTLYGPLACRGGRHSYSQAQAEGRHGSLSHSTLSQNSVWEFPVTSRSHPSLDPSHPPCLSPKNYFFSILSQHCTAYR